MIALLAMLFHVPVDIDLTLALSGRPINGAPQVLMDEDASWVFSLNELPSFYRFDIPDLRFAYEGERLSVATLAGLKIGIATTSQEPTVGRNAQLAPGHPAHSKPILALSKNRLLVLAASGGVVPLEESTRLARRSFALSIVNLDARGENPNSVFLLPRDEHGWYEAVDGRTDQGGSIEVLLAHTIGGSSITRLEAYRLSGDHMARTADGPFAKLDGKSLRVWESVKLARGEWPHGWPRIAADPTSGSVAFVSEGGVTVAGKRVALQNADSVRYIGGTLFAGTRRNPDMKTVSETFEWHPNDAEFRSLGGFQIAGASPRGKYWVVYFPHSGRYRLAPVYRR